MDVKYINPFLAALGNVFETMVNVPFNLGKPHVKGEKVPTYEVSGIIGLSGGITGCVVISLSKQVALQLAAMMLL